MTDFHTHLDLYKNPLAVAGEANRRNEFTLCVTTSPRAWMTTSRAFEKLDNIAVGLGLHPEIVRQKINELDMMVANIPKAKFIGEIGMDGMPQNKKTWQLQKRIFIAILDECQRCNGRVLSVHSRRAESSVLEALENHPDAGVCVLHWFTGTCSDLRKAIDIGCYFSVNKLMALSNHGRELIAEMPRDRVLPESDGPFAQMDMKPLLPWQNVDVAVAVSDIWGLPQKDVAVGFLSVLEKILHKT